MGNSYYSIRIKNQHLHNEEINTNIQSRNRAFEFNQKWCDSKQKMYCRVSASDDTNRSSSRRSNSLCITCVSMVDFKESFRLSGCLAANVTDVCLNPIFPQIMQQTAQLVEIQSVCLHLQVVQGMRETRMSSQAATPRRAIKSLDYSSFFRPEYIQKNIDDMS